MVPEVARDVQHATVFQEDVSKLNAYNAEQTR